MNFNKINSTTSLLTRQTKNGPPSDVPGAHFAFLVGTDALKGIYSLGPIYLTIGNLINSLSEARAIAIPYLTKLSKQVSEPALIAFENGVNEIFSEQVSDPSYTQKILTISPSNRTRTLPLHCTAVGKIILAELSEKELQRYMDTNKLEKYTSHTIVDVHEMNKQLVKIRKNGVAFDDDEFEIGVSVAAGIRNHERKLIGAIGVTAPSVRLTLSRLEEITALVKTCATEISQALGFQN